MDVREKLVEMSDQLRYCADVSDCANCKRWDKVCENKCVDNLLLMAADLIDEVANGVTVQEDCKACAEATQNCIVKLQEQIAELRSVQEWISVKDHTPKEKGCYLIAGNHWWDGKPVAREAFWNGDDWLSCYDKGNISRRVTHWQHLPQPPKGE